VFQATERLNSNNQEVVMAESCLSAEVEQHLVEHADVHVNARIEGAPIVREGRVGSVATDSTLDDEGLLEAVRRELREDAATTALNIEVEVWDRVAHLRGVVAGPEDAEAAEEVAARVPGVGEVADDLVVG
jgi:osmotically-inducible protein OsmY